MEFVSILTIGSIYFGVGVLVAISRLPRLVKQLICIGLVLRVVGAGLRWRIIVDFYGRGDAERYYLRGLEYAESFRKLDFAPIYELIESGKVWGTQFLEVLSGVVLTFLGPAIFSEFLVFTLGAFVGLICFCVAFQRSNPPAGWHRYVMWMMIFPSLWFWTASVGKEAVLMLGLGVAVLGYVGSRQRIQWPLLLGGAGIVYAARPELAAVLLVSMLIAQWFSMAGPWTFSKVVQTVVFSVTAIFILQYATAYMGIETWSAEGVQSYIENDPSRRATGKTNVTAVGIDLLQAPLAAANVYFRPFPWETTNLLVLASSLEILAFILIGVMRRRNLVSSLRGWRSNRLLRLAVVFSLLYPVGLGMMVVNLGIIARQRVLLFPFLFALLEGRPQEEPEAVAVAQRIRDRQPVRYRHSVTHVPRVSSS